MFVDASRYSVYVHVLTIICNASSYSAENIRFVKCSNDFSVTTVAIFDYIYKMRSGKIILEAHLIQLTNIQMLFQRNIL